MNTAIRVCTLLLVFGAAQFATAQDYLCRVKVVHYVEGARLKNLVSHFYFSNGTQYVCDKDYNAGHGEACYCDSNSNTKCTKRVSTVVRIELNGESYTLTADDEAPSGQCLIFLPYEIGRSYAINEKAAKGAKTDGEKLAAFYSLKRYNYEKRTFEHVPLKLATEDFETLRKKMKDEAEKAKSDKR